MAINNNNFENTVKHQLDSSVNDLDAATLSKLNQARQHALSHSNKISRSYSSWITGIFASAVMAVLIITVIPISQQQALPSLTAEQMELLVISDDELDLYKELEFYQWLDDTNG